MPPLYVVEQGALVRSVAQRLVVEKDGQELRSVPLEQVDEVVIVGNATLTTPAMKLLLFEGVDTVFLTLDGLYCGRLAARAVCALDAAGLCAGSGAAGERAGG